MRPLVAALVFLLGLAGATPAAAAHDASGARVVHVVWANHLDVGFTGWDNETLNAYFHSHIPRALWLADWAARADPPEAFVWTSHPWLLSLYLDCPQHIGVACPSTAQQQAVRAAMRAGTITWHAAPFNMDWELLPGNTQPTSSSSSSRLGRIHHAGGLLWSALEVGRQLDRQLQVPHKTVISLRDVPGLTRAAIPLLAAEGIRVLTVGVNAGSAPPDVPLDTPFIWRDPPSGASLMAVWHAGGYGGSCVDDTAPPGSPELQVACARQCVTAQGLGDALCLSWRADNQGPPQDSLEVASVLNLLRRQWAAEGVTAVRTSTLQAWADKLTAAVDGGRVQLQVVEAEIGDTWVYGVASDPLKVANFKAAARARQACAAAADAASGCDVRSPAVSRFDRLLLKVPEHTWGLDVKTTLQDFDCCGTYSNSHLHACMRAGQQLAGPDPPGCGGMSRLVTSWQRQAAYVDWALQELPCGHPILSGYASDLQQRLDLAAAALNSHGKRLLRRQQQQQQQQQHTTAAAAGRELVFRGSSWVVGVDKHTGAITTLCRAAAPSAQQTTAQHAKPSAAQQPDPCEGSHNWAASSSSSKGRTGQSLFASPLYVVFRDADYDVVWNEYAWEGPPNTNPWFKKDLSHPGLNSSWDKHVEVQAQLEEVYDSSDSSSLSLQLHYSLPAWLHKSAGAPARLVLLLTEPPAASAATPVLQLSLVWVNKTATRIPEATWLRFALDPQAAVDPTSWRLHKMGTAIDPLEVMRNGSFSMHAVDDVTGITVLAAPHTSRASQQQQQQPRRLLQITPLDAPLVSPGRPLVLPNVRHPPDLAHGVSFNLHNNLFGTNFCQWLPYTSSRSSDGGDGGAATGEDAGCGGSGSSRFRGGWWQRCHCGGGNGGLRTQAEAVLKAAVAGQRVAVFRFLLSERQQQDTPSLTAAVSAV